MKDREKAIREEQARIVAAARAATAASIGRSVATRYGHEARRK